MAAAPHAAAAGAPGHALALPRSDFPHGSTLHGSVPANVPAERASGVHTRSFDRLSRTGGYVQTAWWRVPLSGHHTAWAELQYLASTFPSEGQADAAQADARASLWEVGHTAIDPVLGIPLTAATERDGHGDRYVIFHRGAVEVELRARRTLSAGVHVDAVALSALRHLYTAAIRRAQVVAAGMTATPVAAPDDPPFEAPWGTGPIVESPSLLGPTVAQVGGDTHLAPAGFRPFAPAPLGARAVRHALLTPTGGLARYGLTGSVPTGSAWYASISLYPSTGTASAALTQLRGANDHRSWLRPYGFDAVSWRAGPLAALDALAGWTLDGEPVAAFRLQNVVVTLATAGINQAGLVGLASETAGNMPTWLHAQGTEIMTASGRPFRIQAVNWYGAEHQDFVVGGLDFQPYRAIIQRVKDLGFNTIRIPLSNQLVEQNPVVSAHLAANPDLQGMHALDILDRIVNYAGAIGLSVILDDHRSDAGWSAQSSGLWYTADYPDAAFDRDWAALAARYTITTAVVGADLRNEPHGPATWGDGNPATDWLAAADRAGNAVLAANPHLLVIIEGVQFSSTHESYWWGGNLEGVQSHPATLEFADGTSARSQLVYSVHDYGPNTCGHGCPWFNSTTTYDTLAATWERFWGYILDNAGSPYAAPVWLGEFGTCNFSQSCVNSAIPGSQGQWFSSLVHYIAVRDMGWAYWSANGTQSTASDRVYGSQDQYGLMDPAWSTPSPWLLQALEPLLHPG